ncbi:MAG: hypothetical protein FWH55_08785 [Oscillospiraceae bacterium]|nr:hypothetical protein [Oscillospiraceae bacterium]
MGQMTAEQAAKAAEGLTFEKVWAALLESRERIEELRESQRETDKLIKESQRETDKLIKESHMENDKLTKEMQKSIGGLGNSLGRIMEDMFSAELYKKFRDIGFTFTKQAERVTFTDNEQVIAEIGPVLENGEYVMLVEIKANLSNDDVDRHSEKMEIIRKYIDARSDVRKIIGAVTGGIVTGGALEYAHNKGLYVVVQSGDAVKIADSPNSFKAREW